jgi:hypothetical protein
MPTSPHVRSPAAGERGNLSRPGSASDDVHNHSSGSSGAGSSCAAPSNDAEQQRKAVFESDLKNLLANISTKDVDVIGGAVTAVRVKTRRKIQEVVKFIYRTALEEILAKKKYDEQRQLGLSYGSLLAYICPKGVNGNSVHRHGGK